MRIKRVREIAAGNAIDASRERVVTNLGCIVQCSSVTRTGTASIDRDGHSGRRIGVDCASIEVAREGVIAAEPFKLVERAEVAVVCARSAVGRSVVNVREHRTLYALDRTQCVVSDRCIACGNGGGSTGAQVDGDATCDGVHVIVTGDIETAATIHEIVAADPREGVVEPAAQQVIVEHRSQYGVHSGESVGSLVASRETNSESRHRRGVEIGDIIDEISRILQIDTDAGAGGDGVVDAGVAVADDRVVSSRSCKVIEGSER